MTRMLLTIIAAVVIILVAATVARTLFWLALIAVIVLFIGALLGVFRFGRRSSRRSRGRY